MTDSQMPPVQVTPVSPVPVVPPAPAATIPATPTQPQSYLKKIYSGRMNRLTYFFGGIVFSLIYYIAVSSITSGMKSFEGMGSLVGALFNLAASIFSTVLSWSFTVRRAHDIGKKWTYLLWLLVPLVNFVIIIILWVRRGEQKENAYGPMTKPGMHLLEMVGIE